MGLSKCHGVIKYSLVFVNLIFWALGLTAAVVAIWMLIDQTFFVSLAQQHQNYVAGLYIILAAGSLLMIVSFLGCCGAFRESRCMLVGFFSCLLIVVVAQIAAGAWLYTNSDRLESMLHDSVRVTVKEEYGQVKYRTELVDSFQSSLNCCGATGPGDWAESKFSRKDSTTPLSLTVTMDSGNTYEIPKSCCKTKDDDLCERARKVKLRDIPNPDIYQEGCTDKLAEQLKKLACITVGVTMSVAALELIGLIFSLILCCSIGSSDRYKA